jgi:hypothetical protein
MSNTIEFQVTRHLQTHTSKPLDETVWRAWLEKNRVEEAQSAVARIQIVKWACIGVLIASGVVSSYISTPYDSAYQAVVRFAIALGATVLMFESLRGRQYSFTVLFAALVLLFNPVLPFALAGTGLFLFASVLPFVASLIWMKERTRMAAVPTLAVG